MKKMPVEHNRGQKMRRTWKQWAVALVIAGVAFSTVAEARPERNAYINRPAPNHAALMNQIRNDQIVMDRYMRHFAMTRQEVLNYFSGLRLTRLSKPYRTPMYNVPDNGTLRSKVYTLRKGTLVWVDSKNTPILKESCGNPLTRGPEKPTANAPVVGAIEPPVGEDLPEISTILPEGFTGEEVFNLLDAMEPGMPILAGELQVPELPATDLVPNTEIPSTPESLLTPGNSPIGFIDDLAPFLALPGLAIPFGFQSPGRPTPPPPPPPAPVPEPATMLALAGGTAWLLRRRARSQS